MKIFYSFVLVLMSLFIVTAVSGQQAAQYSLYSFNPYHFNPAYGGMDGSLSATGVFRKQWTGLIGSPTTQGLNVHMPFYFLNGGVGLSIENDILGAERNTQVTASYNYIQSIGRESVLSLGFAGGFVQKALDGALLRAPDGVYEGPTINHNDPILSEGLQSGIAPVLNAGIFFRSPTIEAGVSGSHLLESSVQFSDNAVTEITFNRNLYFTFAYNIYVGEKLQVKPSVFVKTDFVQTQIDFSGILTYNGNIIFGSSLRGYNERSLDAVVLIAGMQVTDNISLAYG
ncbi:MAG: PorP/SprF family type IX secretion system membrane protein, partial [Bacteroidota bacterium]